MKYYIVNKVNKNPIIFNNRELVFLYFAKKLDKNESIKEKLYSNGTISQRKIIKNMKSLYNLHKHIREIYFIANEFGYKIYNKKEWLDE